MPGDAVFCLAGDVRVELEPLVQAGGRPVEELPLLVEPGVRAHWRGRDYTLNTEGLHCFVGGCGHGRQVIAFREDYMALFFALSQIHVKGWRHRALSVPERIEVARRGRLSVMCGGIASVALDLLARAGHRARRVVMLTVGQASNHVLLEYFARDIRKWVLVDIHNHALLKSEGTLLNAAELAHGIRAGAVIGVYRLSRLGAVDYFYWQNGEEAPPGAERTIYDDLSALAYFGNPARRWAIFDESGVGGFAEDDNVAAARLCALHPGQRAMPSAEWKARFYAESR